MSLEEAVCASPDEVGGTVGESVDSAFVSEAFGRLPAPSADSVLCESVLCESVLCESVLWGEDSASAGCEPLGEASDSCAVAVTTVQWVEIAQARKATGKQQRFNENMDTMGVREAGLWKEYAQDGVCVHPIHRISILSEKAVHGDGA